MMEAKQMELVVLIQLGDRIQFITDTSYWVLYSGEIRIPKGSIGTVVPWNGSNACAMRIDGKQHPAFLDFPMIRTFPGRSAIPSSMALVERKKVEEDGPLEPPQSWSTHSRRRQYAR